MDSNTKKTRSGRLVKPPERYTPNEKVEDDYASDEYDSDSDSDNDDVPSLYSSEEEDDDSEGSLKDFIVPDDDEDDESDSDS